jgi:hypothetical protein
VFWRVAGEVGGGLAGGLGEAGAELRGDAGALGEERVVCCDLGEAADRGGACQPGEVAGVEVGGAAEAFEDCGEFGGLECVEELVEGEVVALGHGREGEVSGEVVGEEFVALVVGEAGDLGWVGGWGGMSVCQGAEWRAGKPALLGVGRIGDEGGDSAARVHFGPLPPG